LITEGKAVKGENKVYCAECAQTISSKAEICIYCGVRQQGCIPATSKNKWIAAILAWFLGGLGIHKFYLGQTNKGILMLLFFWTFIPAIIAFVEAILLLCMSEETFAKKFGDVPKLA